MGLFLWLSDLHLDPLYGTTYAASHQSGENCRLAGNETLLHYPLGRVGCDSPPSLLDSSLRSAAGNAKIYHTGINGSEENRYDRGDKSSIEFIVVTGDFSRHSMEKVRGRDPIAFAESVLSSCIGSIASAFPGVPIVPVLGNNDLVPDYYLDTTTTIATTDTDYNSTSGEVDDENYLPPNSNPMLVMVQNGFQESFLSDEEIQTFARGGYFSRVIETASDPPSSILILSLNTIIYSVKHEPHEPTLVPESDGEETGDDDDPLGQFDWIESQLEAAAANHSNISAVYMVGHIAPSIGSYRHSDLWQQRYIDRYFSILKAYTSRSSATTNADSHPPPILGNLYGHVHTEEFRLLTYQDEDDDDENNSSNSTPALVLPLHVAASLTPIYGANPSYRIVEFDNGSGTLLDYTTYYLDLDRFPVESPSEGDDSPSAKNVSWTKLPGFAETYGVPDLSADSLERILERLEGELQASIRAEEKAVELGREFAAHTKDSSRLWDIFLKRQMVYSSTPDDGDDENNGEIDTMIDWLCTLRAVSKESYTLCVEGKQSAVAAVTTTAPSGGVLLFLFAGMAIAISVVLVLVLFAGKQFRTRPKRRHYRRPSQGELPTDGVVVVPTITGAAAGDPPEVNAGTIGAIERELT
ncbi:unnamed protein product [Pseudo-nitzschia multistriata]|uniref:Calcineurin-like phosphoesterase domain-containing protein n=1 Tax=Pseudo-nitzschia multistriata TaxID=183589 RepID=A0A448YUY5_9STRA|nr:unnamed protein product [Pseudo-nitzschia multistriata]